MQLRRQIPRDCSKLDSGGLGILQEALIALMRSGPICQLKLSRSCARYLVIDPMKGNSMTKSILQSHKVILASVMGATIASIFAVNLALADGHAKLGIEAVDQDVSGGTVSATSVVARENGWLVIHRTGDDSKPGPVVGHAPLKKGSNSDVAAILTEPVASGDKLMLMIHSEQGGSSTGIFEYTLGAKEDGPIRVDGNLVMKIVTAN